MSTKSRLGLGVLGAALLLGLLGDGLLRAEPLGLNVFLWIAAVGAAVWVLIRWFGLLLVGQARWLVAGGVVLAGGFVWRDSPPLLMLDLLAAGVALALAGGIAGGGDLRRLGLGDYAMGMFMSAVNAAGGMLMLLAGDIKWEEIPRGRWSEQIRGVVRGLLIALPLLLVFGVLFVAADAVFERLVTDLVGTDLDSVLSHVILTSFLAWICGGFLRLVAAGRSPDPLDMQRPASLTLGSTETAVALGLLNALFLAFVLVQFRYFFGGAALVEARAGLTYAEYARQGFFELAGVTALVLPVLLVAHWLLPREQPAAERLFRWLAGALVAQLFIIVASAIQRMMLYQREFGLTELRLYVTVFMGWLTVLFVWLVLTVLRGRRERFAFGALVTGLLVLAGLHVLNPDAFIARTNLGRWEAGLLLDEQYVTTLSADAVPVLVEALPGLPDKERQVVAARVLQRWAPAGTQDWRTWNWGRERARQSVANHLDMLQAAAGK